MERLGDSGFVTQLRLSMVLSRNSHNVKYDIITYDPPDPTKHRNSNSL